MALWDGLIGTLGAVVAGSLLAGLVAFGSRLWHRSGRCGSSSPSTCMRTGRCSSSVWSASSSPWGGRIRGARSAHSRAQHARRLLRPSSSWASSAPSAPACRRRPSPECGSPWSPGRAGVRCRFAPPSSAPSWRSRWSWPPSRSGPASTPWSAIRRSTAGTGPTTWTAGADWATSRDRPRPSFLNADPLVQSWTGVSYSTLQLDGVNVPVMGATPRAAVAPPLLSGHGLESADQVVLGAETLRELHKQVGRHRGGAAQRAAGEAHDRRHRDDAAHRCHGVVAPPHGHRRPALLLADPAAARNLFEVTPGPNAILVRTKGEPAARRCARSRPSGASSTSRSTAARCSPCSGRRRSSTTARWARPPCSWGRRWPAGAVGVRSASPWLPRSGGDGATWRSSRRSGSPGASWRGRRRAGGRRRRHRMRRRDPGGDRARAGALGPVRRRDQCGPLPDRPARPSSPSGSSPIALAVLVATIPGRIAARTCHLAAPPGRVSARRPAALSRRTARPAPHRHGAPCRACRSAC